MTDRQVAERLRSYLYGRPVYGRDKNTADNARAADTLRIVRAYLREHDPTPLTEEWIKKALPPTGSPSPGSHESANYSTAIGKMSWIRWETGHARLMNLKTSMT